MPEILEGAGSCLTCNDAVPKRNVLCSTLSSILVRIQKFLFANKMAVNTLCYLSSLTT